MRSTYRRTVAFTPRRSELGRLLNARGLLGDGVEVGVQQGLFSEQLLSTWRGTRLHLVDPWQSFLAEDYVDVANRSQERQDELHEETVQRVRPFGARAKIHRAASPQAAERFADASLDFVYLDARHDYPSVLADLEAWYPKVRRGGLLAGHDYVDGTQVDWDSNETEFGVRSAVDGFCEGRGLTPWGTYRDAPFTSFIAVVGGAPPHPLQRLAALGVRLLATVVRPSGWRTRRAGWRR